MLKKINFKIEGLHCQSCKTLIETEIDVLPGVKKINVDYLQGNADLEFDDAKISKEQVWQALKKINYKPVEVKTNEKKTANNSYLIGLLVPVSLAFFVVVYWLFNKYGGWEILAALNEPNIGYGLIFVIGILASFHCIGMCGGIVIAYSTLSNQNDQTKALSPHFQYNLGRLISYTIIGGILGGLGKFFGVNPLFTGIVMFVAGSLMILMGLSFVTKWSILEKIKVKTPDFIARFLFNQKHSNSPKGPLVIGLLNGFMPCGPLQAMQLYALASGSFTKGALSMAIYALGTIPLMFGFGFFITKISNRFMAKIIKVSGVLVIVLGIIMLSRGLTNLGGAFQTEKNSDSGVIITDGYQEVRMELGAYGYEPNVLYVKEGLPVRWIINVKQMSGCTNAIRMDAYNISKNLQYGENIIEFTPKELGEIKFSCWMKMVWGKFIVTESGLPDEQSKNGIINNALASQANVLPTGGCGCGGGSGSCH